MSATNSIDSFWYLWLLLGIVIFFIALGLLIQGLQVLKKSSATDYAADVEDRKSKIDVFPEDLTESNPYV